jgi:hypothetical protein
MTQHRSLDPLSVRVIVTDAEVLGRLDPASVAAYLAGSGWAKVTERRGGRIFAKYTVWSKRLTDGSEPRVLLPGEQTYADYPIRLGELLTMLAQVEGRSQLAVLADLYRSAAGGHQPLPDEDAR